MIEFVNEIFYEGVVYQNSPAKIIISQYGLI